MPVTEQNLISPPEGRASHDVLTLRGFRDIAATRTSAVYRAISDWSLACEQGGEHPELARALTHALFDFRDRVGQLLGTDTTSVAAKMAMLPSALIHHASLADSIEERPHKIECALKELIAFGMARVTLGTLEAIDGYVVLYPVLRLSERAFALLSGVTLDDARECVAGDLVW